MGEIEVSVVIPCRNGASFISKQIDALLAQQTSALFEIIVANNGSTDETAEIIEQISARDRRVRLVDASRAVGVNVARNVGVRSANAGVILLTDADDVVHPGWLEAYRSAFAAGAQCAGGALNRVLADGTVLATECKLYRSQAANAAYANGTNCAFTVEAFQAVGGFDESFAGGADEVEFFWRLAWAGYRLQLVGDAVVDKLQHSDLNDAFVQHFKFGCGEARLMQKARPRLIQVAVGLACLQTLIWSAGWLTTGWLPAARRKVLCTLAFNIGVLYEGVRLCTPDSMHVQSPELALLSTSPTS